MRMRSPGRMPGAALAPARWATLSSVVLGVAVALVGMTLMLVSVASPASAHAQLVSASPANGATVTSPPAEVVLTFSEDINPQFARVAVSGGGDSSYVDGEPRVDGAVVTQPVVDLPVGDYTITFRVVSADGHPVSDTLTFRVASATTDTSADNSTSSDPSSASDSRGTSSSATGPAATTANGSPTEASTDTSSGDRSGIGGGAATLIAIVALAVLLGGGLLVAFSLSRDSDADGGGHS